MVAGIEPLAAGAVLLGGNVLVSYLALSKQPDVPIVYED